MPTFDTLTDFLAVLEDDGELVRIAEPVDPTFELAAVARAFGQRDGGGPAVLFEHVRGASAPVIANLFGRRERLCRGLGVANFEEVAARIAGLIQPHVPTGWLAALRMVPQLTQLAALPPKVVKSGVSQQVVQLGRDVDLRQWPFPRCWPTDSGASISAGNVVTKDPLTGVRDVGLVPLTVLGPQTLAVHWTPHDDGWRNYVAHRELERPMPVAVALGGDPTLSFAAFAPLPPQTDACVLAGLLRGRPIELLAGRSVDLDVPAAAEIVIEGRIDFATPLERVASLGRWTGFAGLPEDLPVLQVTAITHRANPVVPAMIPGPPPNEQTPLGELVERCLLPFVRLFAPEVVDLRFPTAGAFRHLVFASIRKQYPHHARRTLGALWSLPLLERTKIAIVVDADVDLRDEQRTWFEALSNLDPQRDVAFWPGPVSMCDHAATVRGTAGRMGIDATRKLPEEGHPRPWPPALGMPEDVLSRIGRFQIEN